MIPPEPSRLHVDTAADRSLEVSGTIDAHTSEDLLRVLKALGSDDDVGLDLSRVDFIDSSGLRTIVLSHQELEGAGHHLNITGLSEPVARLFDITGLRDHLNIG